MTDLQDFEQRLRTDLAFTASRIAPPANAAERTIDRAISHGIGRVRIPDRRSRARLHRNRWLLPMAAATTALIALSMTVLAIDSHRGAVPGQRTGPTAGSSGATAGPTGSTASQSPVASATTTTPAPSASPTPIVVDGIHAAACRITEPSRFFDAFHGVSVPMPPGVYDSAGLPILSVTSAGEVLAGPQIALPGRLDLIAPDGSRRTLYRTTDVPLTGNQTAAVSSAQGDSRWIVFAVTVSEGGGGSVTRLGVVNRATGAVTTFRVLLPNSTTIILAPVLYQGIVYWSEFNSGASGSVLSYDPVTGNTTTVDTGNQLSPVTAVGGGLFWQHDGKLVTYRPGQVPAGYHLDGGKFGTLVTDGTTSIFVDSNQAGAVLELSRPGMSAPVPIYQAPSDTAVIPEAVAGPFVIWDDGNSLVALDTRTGATTAISAGSEPPFIRAASGGPILAVNYIGSKGGSQLTTARIASLPELHC